MLRLVCRSFQAAIDDHCSVRHAWSCFWDLTEEYVYTFVFAGLSILISGVLAISIVFVKRRGRSRSVSESTDIAQLPTGDVFSP